MEPDEGYVSIRLTETTFNKPAVRSALALTNGGGEFISSVSGGEGKTGKTVRKTEEIGSGFSSPEGSAGGS